MGCFNFIFSVMLKSRFFPTLLSTKANIFNNISLLSILSFIEIDKNYLLQQRNSIYLILIVLTTAPLHSLIFFYFLQLQLAYSQGLCLWYLFSLLQFLHY